MANEMIIQTDIENKILTIRNQQVMIDRDLAELVANCDQFRPLKHKPFH